MIFEEKSFTVSEIVEAWRNNSLQRNDEYQRGETWNLQQKQALIDSILRGYPIPSIFLHSKIMPGLGGTVSEKFEVVDGQQRIIALADYLTDKFELLEATDKRLKLPMSMRTMPVTWAKRSFTRLSVDDQNAIKLRKLNVYVLRKIDQEDQVRDLFIRLQSGTALTRQQIRDAWPGAIGPFIEAMAGKMNRHPAIQVFAYVDGRGTRDDENDSRDPYVKHRTTCAQVVHILLGRINDPARVPSVGAAELDALYHEQTNLDMQGESIRLIREIFERCDVVSKYFDIKAGGRKKLPKVGLFCLAMFFQDIRKNPLLKLDERSMRELAHFVCDDAPKPLQRTNEGFNVKSYYELWREALPTGIGIVLDPRRQFSSEQKDELWTRDNGICQICLIAVTRGEDEYDHYPVLYRDGGLTEVSNGRLVHAECHPRGRMQYKDPSTETETDSELEKKVAGLKRQMEVLKAQLEAKRSS